MGRRHIDGSGATLSYHCWEFYGEEDSNSLRNKGIILLEKPVLRSAVVITVPTPEYKQAYVAERGADPNKVLVVHNVADLPAQKGKARLRRRFGRDSRIITYIGALMPGRFLEVMPEILANLPDSAIWVVAGKDIVPGVLGRRCRTGSRPPQRLG